MNPKCPRHPNSPDSRRDGFALLAILAGMVVMLVVGLGLLTLSTIELRRAGTGTLESQAKARARLSLNLALGELQRFAGPDTRATGEAAILGDTLANPHWTGVWNTRGSDGKSFLRRDDRNGGLADLRQSGGWNRESSALAWLASGAVSPRSDPGTDAIELVGASQDPGGRRVTAKRIAVDGGNAGKGGYAWWVGDLGVRANLATPDAFQSHAPDAATAGDGGWFRRMIAQEADATLSGGPADAQAKRKLASESTRSLSASRIDRTRFHDFTVHSEGVLADMEAGGLKRDLTAFLASNGRIDDRNGLPGLSDNDNLVGPANAAAASRDGLDWTSTRHRFTSPKFGLLRKWARDAAPFKAGSVPSVVPKTEDSPKVSDSNALALSNLSPAAIASLDTPNRAPILVEGSLGFTFSWHRTAKPPGGGAAKYPYQVRIHVYPRVVLWNPYNVDLELEPVLAMIQGNGRQEMWTEIYYPPNDKLLYRAQWIWFEGGRSTNFTPSGGSILESEGYKDPYIGCFYFSIPKTRFKPGECLVFSPEKGAEYERPIDGSSGYALEKNALSCETSPDPSRNYYMSNDEVDGGISFVPKNYWFEPTTAWKAGGINNQGDDCRVILKRLGDRRNVTFEDFDALPQVSVVSASLQYGAGREPRLAWNKVEKMPTEETATVNPKATIAPNVRTREGIRLRWFNETLSNQRNSGALTNTAHFEDALIANWNPRAAYSTRSPWDNLAGSLPSSGSAGGPWFFGAYTRDLYDQAVSWQDQMPVYRDGRYHGNPFGTPQEAIGPIVLFDVPRRETGIVSIGQFQHAKLSEFIWHPSYAVGQSLADPRGPSGRSTGLNRTAPLFRDATDAANGGFSIDAIGFSSDAQRGANRDAWARQGRAIYQDYPTTDNLVYDLSYEVNRTLWDAFFLSGADDARARDFLKDPVANPLPNGRLRPAPTSGRVTAAADLRDLHQAASRLMVDGAFNVNSTSVEAWKALLSGARAASPDGRVRFPRVLQAPGNTWSSTNSARDGSAWNGERALSDSEVDRLARAIVEEVRKRGPFLSLADFVNRRLADNDTGRSGPLQAAIDAAGLNSPFESAFPLNNSKSLPDYTHPDQVRDATRLEQTLKPSTKAWGAPGFLTQGDVLQVIGPVINARSDTFVIRGYGDAADSTGTIRARAWCEAVVQRTPEPLKPDASGLNCADAGKAGDFGRRFIVKSFRWLKREEI